MKQLLFIILLCVPSWAQNGGVVPAPDIAGSINQSQQTSNQTRMTAAQVAQLRQQTALLKQQTEMLKQQNELMKVSTAARKPRIDDIDVATGKPRFATYAEYEDAKDEWLIEETLRRFALLQK